MTPEQLREIVSKILVQYEQENNGQIVGCDLILPDKRVSYTWDGERFVNMSTTE